MGKIIAVLLIMIGINVFMLFAVRKAAFRADSTVRKYFLDSVGSIDIWEGKNADADADGYGGQEADGNSALRNKTFSSANGNNGGISVPVVQGSDGNVINYKNIDFKKEYKMVKSKMTMSKREIIYNVLEHEEIMTDKSFDKLIENIRNRFNFDMIYNLSTLGPEYQLMILRETLLANEQTILDRFLEDECVGDFSCIDFFSYIEQLAYIYDSHYYVMTGWKSDNFENISDGIVMIYDENICEGIRIMHQNRVHDYSI